MDITEVRTLEDARAYFQNDVYATTMTGCTIVDCRPGYALCRMQIGPEHKNAIGLVMGGAVYTLADFAFAVASNMEGRPTVTLTSTISFLSTARGEYVEAEAVQIKSGRNTCYYRTTVTDSTGRVVAEAVTNGFVTEKK